MWTTAQLGRMAPRAPASTMDNALTRYEHSQQFLLSLLRVSNVPEEHIHRDSSGGDGKQGHDLDVRTPLLDEPTKRKVVFSWIIPVWH